MRRVATWWFTGRGWLFTGSGLLPEALARLDTKPGVCPAAAATAGAVCNPREFNSRPACMHSRLRRARAQGTVRACCCCCCCCWPRGLAAGCSLPVRWLFTACSLPVRCLFAACSLPVRCLFTGCCWPRGLAALLAVVVVVVIWCCCCFPLQADDGCSHDSPPGASGFTVSNLCEGRHLESRIRPFPCSRETRGAESPECTA